MSTNANDNGKQEGKQRIDLGEALGRIAGLGFAPVALVGAALRDARFFHPRGQVYRAEVVAPREQVVGAPEGLTRLGERLVGPALVRLSSGWWKGKEWPDVLGAAVRFRRVAPVSAEAEDGDQDLLFATAKHVLTLPLATLATNVHDFLANDYFAISPYHLEGVGRVKLSLAAQPSAAHAGTRQERLAAAVAAASATLRLVVTTRDGRSVPVADIDLVEHVGVDQERLRFSPFHAGRGLDPVGFVHGLRWAAYAASRLGDRARSPEVLAHTER